MAVLLTVTFVQVYAVLTSLLSSIVLAESSPVRLFYELCNTRPPVRLADARLLRRACVGPCAVMLFLLNECFSPKKERKSFLKMASSSHRCVVQWG